MLTQTRPPALKPFAGEVGPTPRMAAMVPVRSAPLTQRLSIEQLKRGVPMREPGGGGGGVGRAMRLSVLALVS